MTRFFVLFLLIVGVLFAAELTSPVQNYFVVPFTSAIARLSASLMQFFDGEVRAYGKVIWDQASGFAVSIEAGCNGVEAGIILLAAILAFPATWTQKLLGIVVGMLTVQFLNIIRIVSLFYLGQWSPKVFEWAHLYVWQAVIMLDVLVVFLLWLRWQANRGRGPAEPGRAAA